MRITGARLKKTMHCSNCQNALFGGAIVLVRLQQVKVIDQFLEKVTPRQVLMNKPKKITCTGGCRYLEPNKTNSARVDDQAPQQWHLGTFLEGHGTTFILHSLMCTLVGIINEAVKSSIDV